MKTIWEGEIESLTPLFCRGAYKNQPEIREPSIRGMVRWWFRKLGGNPEEEKAIFGGMKKFGRNNTVQASTVIFRIIEKAPSDVGEFPTLPHKRGGDANPQQALGSSTRFRLKVLTQRSGLPVELEAKTQNAIEVWILLGALGLRANRAGGSLWPVGDRAPQTAADFKQRLLAAGCRWPVYLASESIGASVDLLRMAATDTVSGRENEAVFGRARGGRLSSPLKMKIIRLDGKLRLLITAPEESLIKAAQSALRGHKSQPEGWVPI